MIPNPSGQLAELIVYITSTRVDMYSHQILLENSNHWSRAFESLRDHTIRRLMRFWITLRVAFCVLHITSYIVIERLWKQLLYFGQRQTRMIRFATKIALLTSLNAINLLICIRNWSIVASDAFISMYSVYFKSKVSTHAEGRIYASVIWAMFGARPLPEPTFTHYQLDS